MVLRSADWLFGSEFAVNAEWEGAGKGKKYCVFERKQEGYRFTYGKVVRWGGTLREICPQDWGFNSTKIKAVTQKPKMRNGPER